MREAIELFERISGRTLELVQGPPAAGDMRRTKADTTRIRADLGWEATTAARGRYALSVGMGLR